MSDPSNCERLPTTRKAIAVINLCIKLLYLKSVGCLWGSLRAYLFLLVSHHGLHGRCLSYSSTSNISPNEGDAVPVFMAPPLRSRAWGSSNVLPLQGLIMSPSHYVHKTFSPSGRILCKLLSGACCSDILVSYLQQWSTDKRSFSNLLNGIRGCVELSPAPGETLGG